MEKNNIIRKGMKGFVEEVPWTAIVLVIAVIAVTVIFIIWIFYQLPFTPGKPFSFTVEFVDLVNKPYLLGSATASVKFDDRTFFEHALQIAVVESLEKSNSEKVHVLMKEYLDKYELNYYSISVIKGDKKIFEITNFVKQCGKDSYCNIKYYETEAGTCNVGWVQTDGDCGDSFFVCCKHDIRAYTDNLDSFAVVPCGKNNIGICSAMPDDLDFWTNERAICGLGKSIIGDPTKNCENVNEQKTPICCAPLDVSVATLSRQFSAKIPILYRDEEAIIQVIAE